MPPRDTARAAGETTLATELRAPLQFVRAAPSGPGAVKRHVLGKEQHFSGHPKNALLRKKPRGSKKQVFAVFWSAAPHCAQPAWGRRVQGAAAGSCEPRRRVSAAEHSMRRAHAL